MNKQPDDQSVKVSVFKNLLFLQIFSEQFKTAIALFDMIQRADAPHNVLRNEYHAYRMIAARDGALSIFHFKCCLESIRKQLPRSRSLSALVDKVKIRDELKRFSVLFPHADSARHAIAHAGEIFKSPEWMKQHGMKVPKYGPGFAVDEGGYLLSALHDRTYSVGNRGEVFSVTLDHIALSNLRSIHSAVQDAFKAALETLGQPRQTQHNS